MNYKPMSNPLVGTWKLISARAIFPDGSVDTEVYGSNPTGYITYAAEGQMMVMFSRSDRPPLSGDATSPFSASMLSVSVEERAQAFSTFSAYAGIYTIKGNTVIHHVEVASIPNRVGKDLVRTFVLNGNQITLKTQPVKSDGVQKVFELLWEKT